jgi:Calx-beta domain/Divergent InlB B-repeat domain
MNVRSRVSGLRGVATVVALLLSFLVCHAQAAAAELTLTWVDNSGDELGFSVERSNGSGSAFGQIGTTEGGTTAYTDTTVSAGTTYCYRVRAFNSSTYSNYSNVACGVSVQMFGLAVVKVGEGTGSVKSIPAGINCGSSCSGRYPAGSVVTLSATAATGSTFSGWSGGGCSGTASCKVTLKAAAVVTATFASQPVSPPGGPTGSVSTSVAIDAPTVTSNANAAVTVTVSAESGTPTGLVSLAVDGGAPLTAMLTNGRVTFTLLRPNAGDHSVAATYAAQGTFGASSASGTLHVDAKPSGGSDVVQFGKATYSSSRIGTRVTIDVVRPDAANTWATVRYSTSDGTAKAGVDYRATSGTLTFKPGAAKRTFVVQLLSKGSGTPKTVNLTLSNVSRGASLGSPSTAVLTMSNSPANTSRMATHSLAAADADAAND